MKKLISLITILALSLCLLASCSPSEDDVVINVGVMSGPTGMGMAQLMSQQNDSYSFTVFTSPDTGLAALADGSVDMLCLPTNSAAALSNKNADYISVLAINCLGSLYVIADTDESIDTISDLAGKTVYTSVANSNTIAIINHILQLNSLDTVNVVCDYADHDSLVAAIKAGTVSIAVLPEPKATAATMGNAEYEIAINLSTAWSDVSTTPLTMGCIVVKNDFLEAHESAVNAFLDDYKASIEFIGNPDNTEQAVEMIVGAGIIPAAPLATNALTHLYGSIVYHDGSEMKQALVAFYTATGVTLPSDDFYYGAD